MGDFSPDEMRALLAQHTAQSGQAFAEEALNGIWELSRGQPWLVNALAYETCFGNKAGRDRSRPITADAVRDARERLILRHDTHLDQRADKLQEERVRRVVEPLLSGAPTAETIPADDLQYVRDLGLVRQTDPVAVANPIYREVIPRVLAYTTQAMEVQQDPASCVVRRYRRRPASGQAAGRLPVVLPEHSQHRAERFQYKEAGPQLLLQAFLQRIVNSGGGVEREYGLGRRRTDLLVIRPVPGAAHRTRKMAIECKVRRHSLAATIDQGLEQTRAYMDRCAAGEGHLVIFDRRADVSWEKKAFCRERAAGDARITVWGM